MLKPPKEQRIQTDRLTVVHQSPAWSGMKRVINQPKKMIQPKSPYLSS